MAASEPIVKAAKGDYPPRPAFTRTRQRGSISEATLTSAMMMVTDVLAVLLALSSCIPCFVFTASTAGWKLAPWPGAWTTLSPGYLLFFVRTLLMVHHRYGVYGPRTRQKSYHEHRRTIQACFDAGLLLCGCMYVMHNTIYFARSHRLPHQFHHCSFVRFADRVASHACMRDNSAEWTQKMC